jgi:hypothetical protein
MMDETWKFWMVWRQGGLEPKFKHPTQHAAVKELERLAQANPGVEFYLLEATMQGIVPPQAVKWTQLQEEPPF